MLEMCRCGQELATSEVIGPAGSVKVGPHCVALIEMVQTLFGGHTKKRPVLVDLRGSVD